MSFRLFLFALCWTTIGKEGEALKPTNNEELVDKEIAGCFKRSYPRILIPRLASALPAQLFHVRSQDFSSSSMREADLALLNTSVFGTLAGERW